MEKKIDSVIAVPDKKRPKDGKELLRYGVREIFSYSFAREKCLCCNRSSVGIPLCRACFRDRLLDFETDFSLRCSVCGKELLSEKKICTRCRDSNMFTHLDQVFPMFSYRLWIKKLIFEWKIGGRRALSPIFAKVFDRGLKTIGLRPEDCVLVPVPPRPGKIRKKGWDQVDEVCSFLEKDYGYSVLKLLERMSSEQQKKKDREQRLDMKGKSYAPSRLCKKRLEKWAKKMGTDRTPDVAVIIDDVITTGVTVDSCAEILKNLGISTVKAVSLVIVD